MWTNITILSLVTLQRLVELYIAHRNTKRLLANGGFEVGSDHYPLFVRRCMRSGWPACGIWALSGAVVSLAVDLRLSGAGSGARLDHRRTGQPLDHAHHRGAGRNAGGRRPLQVFRHPNYMVVAGEIFILPMAFGLWWYAILFAALNAALLYWRIRSEDAGAEAIARTA